MELQDQSKKKLACIMLQSLNSNLLSYHKWLLTLSIFYPLAKYKLTLQNPPKLGSRHSFPNDFRNQNAFKSFKPSFFWDVVLFNFIRQYALSFQNFDKKKWDFTSKRQNCVNHKIYQSLSQSNLNFLNIECVHSLIIITCCDQCLWIY